MARLGFKRPGHQNRGRIDNVVTWNKINICACMGRHNSNWSPTQQERCALYFLKLARSRGLKIPYD